MDPARVRLAMNVARRLVEAVSAGRGGFYIVERISQTDDEYRISVGGPTLGNVGPGNTLDLVAEEYPFPTIDVELERLRNEWMRLGGTAEEFNAWAPGDDYDSKT